MSWCLWRHLSRLSGLRRSLRRGGGGRCPPFRCVCTLVHLCFVLFTGASVVCTLPLNLMMELRDRPHCLRATLAKDHLSAQFHVFGVLDEPEPTRCLVACAEMFFIHTNNGSCLPQAPTMHHGLVTSTDRGWVVDYYYESY